MKRRGLLILVSDCFDDVAGLLQAIGVLRRRGHVVPRPDILEAIWGEASESAAASLEVLIGRLRRKLSPGGGEALIRTHRGLRVHRTCVLEPADVVHHRGVPVTSAARRFRSTLAAIGDPSPHGASLLVKACGDSDPVLDSQGCLEGRIARADGSVRDY